MLLLSYVMYGYLYEKRTFYLYQYNKYVRTSYNKIHHPNSAKVNFILMTQQNYIIMLLIDMGYKDAFNVSRTWTQRYLSSMGAHTEPRWWRRTQVAFAFLGIGIDSQCHPKYSLVNLNYYWRRVGVGFGCTYTHCGRTNLIELYPFIPNILFYIVLLFLLME